MDKFNLEEYILKKYEEREKPTLLEKIFITKEIVPKKETIYRRYDDKHNITT
jgi:hypothetical protein